MKLNTSSILAILAASTALVTAAPVLADDAHHPEAAVASQPATTQGATESTEGMVKMMQANVQKMQTQLDRIAKANTDSEREQAIAEHVRTMQENMLLIRNMQAGMSGCPMMGGQPGVGMMGPGMMMGGGMMGPGMGSNPDFMSQRLEMMEQRMDMMQMMMQNRMGMPSDAPMRPTK